MVPFCVIVHYVFGYRCAQVSLTERYEAVETLSTYGENESFRICVQIRTISGKAKGLHDVLFVIDIATRCVCIGGITSDPNGEWMKQVARNLTDMWDGFLLGKRYLIHDRDPLFTEAVRGLLRDSGLTNPAHCACAQPLPGAVAHGDQHQREGEAGGEGGCLCSHETAAEQ